jgi:sterol O-acyltransferase
MVRQCTNYDNRQNETSADSPFHGFFTLFWLGTAIFMIQVAARNWQNYGNVLGTNEIMGLMLDRDLLVLALSDGLLCASTGVGYILQKLVFWGYVNWAREGWIIQNVTGTDILK